MVRLLLLRHGKTSWNAEKRLQGRRDIGLSPEGRTELSALKVPAEFAGYRWVTSPLQRARDTAELLGAREATIAPALVEMDWGEWEGETLENLRSRYGAEFERNEARGLLMSPPGGESPRAVIDRLTPWLKNLREDTIAVTHKGVIRALKSLAYNWDMMDKAPVRFDWRDGHLFEVDDAGRLRPLRVNIKLETI